MGENKVIPIGWATASVQDIADVIMGQSPPSSTYNKDEIGLPFFQGKAEFTELHPVVEKWCSKPKKIAINNDILLSVRAPVGTTNIADMECCIGRGLAAIRYHHKHKFLYYYFRLIENELDKKGTGTTFRAISGNVIKSTRLFLPPLPEQHRIVAKIEELLSSLDKGIESLKTAQQQLKVYRQAVLKWAFEGKLTNKNVVDGALPQGWKVVTVDEIGKVKGGKRLPKGGAYSEGPTKYPYLRVTDFENQTINQKKLKFLTDSTQAQIKNYIISNADVYISIAGTIGTTGTIPENLDGANLTENAAKITDLKNIYNKYLSQFLASMKGQSQIREHTKTTTQPKLSLFRSNYSAQCSFTSINAGHFP